MLDRVKTSPGLVLFFAVAALGVFSFLPWPLRSIPGAKEQGESAPAEAKGHMFRTSNAVSRACSETGTCPTEPPPESGLTTGTNAPRKMYIIQPADWRKFWSENKAMFWLDDFESEKADPVLKNMFENWFKYERASVLRNLDSAEDICKKAWNRENGETTPEEDEFAEASIEDLLGLFLETENGLRKGELLVEAVKRLADYDEKTYVFMKVNELTDFCKFEAIGFLFESGSAEDKELALEFLNFNISEETDLDGFETALGKELEMIDNE